MIPGPNLRTVVIHGPLAFRTRRLAAARAGESLRAVLSRAYGQAFDVHRLHLFNRT